MVGSGVSGGSCGGTRGDGGHEVPLIRTASTCSRAGIVVFVTRRTADARIDGVRLTLKAPQLVVVSKSELRVGHLTCQAPDESARSTRTTKPTAE